MLNYRMPIEVSEYKYNLPANLIANHPTIPRDHCRLMLIDRKKSKITHRYFYDLLDLLTENDVLILNQSRVFPARIFGKKNSGGQVEVLLYHQIDQYSWNAISRPGLKIGTIINFPNSLSAKVLDRNLQNGETLIKFNIGGPDFFSVLDKIGMTPIPPYIKATDSEKSLRKKYQTVYAKEIGSAAAPTAGLHFTKEMLNQLKNRGVQIEYLTLHVGLGTFQPLRKENLETGKLHTEFYEINKETAARLNLAKKNSKRIIAVGTTTVRALESAVEKNNNGYEITAKNCSTNIFIYPPYKFNFVDALITNFHLPESSLLMLVNAFTSSPNSLTKNTSFNDSLIKQAYEEAIKSQYHFFSFGDAMLII